MTSGRDEVQDGVYPIIFEPGITFNARLLSQDIVILTFEVSEDLLKAKKRLGMTTPHT